MILDDIVEKVHQRLSERKRRVSIEDLKARVQKADQVRDFYMHLRRGEDEKVRVIAEVKKASPSQGIIREDFDPVEIALAYEQSGASAISVLTEEDFFLGDREYLEQIRRSVKVPLLRKDFIIEPYQVMEARVLGADAYLLIISLLTDSSLEELMQLGQELGMAALVEVHSEEDLDRALRSPVKIIGINNRDLKTFVTDIQTTSRLVKRIPEGIAVVSESGIRSPEDLQQMEHFGIDAVLVGEVLMRAPHPGEKLRELLGYERES